MTLCKRIELLNYSRCNYHEPIQNLYSRLKERINSYEESNLTTLARPKFKEVIPQEFDASKISSIIMESKGL